MASTDKLGSTLLVLVEQDPSAPEAIAPSSGKLVQLARTLTTGKVVALALTQDSDVPDLASLGADQVLVVDAPGFSPRVPAAVANAVAAGLSEVGAAAVLLSSTYVGRAAAAMVAVTCGVGAAVDVASVSVEDGVLIGRKSALAGTWMTTFTSDQGPVLALRPGTGPAEGLEVPSGSATVAEVLPVQLSESALRTQVVSSMVQPAGARVSLADAEVVVVVGRGVGGDISVAEDLADALGGALGATRVVCDEGWMPRSAQIGQTGVSIAPKLYIGLGVSGAVHHTCGMLASERIVAVVDDPDAPILELADFAVVGDIFEVVPKALAVLAKHSVAGD